MRGTFLTFMMILWAMAVLAKGNRDSLEKILPGASGTQKLEILNKLIGAYEHSDPNKSVQYFKEFEKNYAELKKPLSFSGIYHQLKGNRLLRESAFDEAISEFKKAEPFFNKQKQYLELWNLYNGLGTAYEEHGDQGRALDYFLKAYKVAEDHLGEGAVNGSAINLGVSYAEAGNFTESLRYFHKSRAYHQKGGAKSWGLGNCLNNIGQVHMLKGDVDSALSYFNKALLVWENMSDDGGIAMTSFNLGSLYTKTKDYIKAEQYLLKSLRISEKINEQYGITQNLSALSTMYLESGQKKKGIEYLERSIQFSKKNKVLTALKSDYNNLYKVYKANGDYKNALSAHEEFFAIYDSLNSAERTKNQQELYSRFETEKKQKEIEKQKASLAGKDLELSRQLNRMVMLGGVLLVAIAIGVFIFISLRQKQKANKILNAQKNEIEKKNEELNQQNEEIASQRDEIERQKLLVENKQKEVLDSIHYAKRIQRALLSHADFLNQQLPHHFIFFQPKDIVSGDFYWATKKDNFIYLAVCDSTGHGVPGAFMSLLNISYLNEAINEKNISDPNEVFNHVRQCLVDNISYDGQRDGMDGILLRIDKNAGLITYAAANNAPVIVRNNRLIELPADKIPVGKSEKKETFHLYDMPIEAGDMVYLYTDGYADQFGGPNRKKFKYKQLEDLLISVSGLNLVEQHNILHVTIESWKGENEQIDDICVMGIKI